MNSIKRFGAGVVLTLALLIGLNSTAGSPHALSAPLATQPAAPGKSLAEQVGFSDPTLDKLQAQGIDQLGESIEFKANGHTYRLLAIWQMMEGSENPIGGAALLYQIASAKPILRWNQDYLKLNGQAPYLTDTRLGFTSWPAPGDWLKNGKTEFAVLGSFAGTSWSNTTLFIYELKSDGSVVSRLKGVIPPGYIAVALERQQDDSLLLTVADIRGEMAMGLPNCCGPHIARYYEWHDDKIIDASAQHPDKYFPDLGGVIFRLTTEQFDDAANYSVRLLELLMMYDALGKRAEGWTLAQSLAQTALKSKRVPSNAYLDKTFLPAMQKLYQENKPFVPPELMQGGQATSEGYYNKEEPVK